MLKISIQQPKLNRYENYTQKFEYAFIEKQANYR